MPDDARPDVPMVVESVRVHMLSSRHVVILKEQDRERYLPIWIGPWEANAIAMRLQGIESERPMTHDLFAAVLGELGTRVDRIRITDLEDDTFHARLVLEGPSGVREVDARPSDAIALAVRLGTPIYASPRVLEHAALGPEGDDEDEATRALGTADLESTGEPIDAGRLDIWRDFVNSLDVEGEQREGPGSSS